MRVFAGANWKNIPITFIQRRWEGVRDAQLLRANQSRPCAVLPHVDLVYATGSGTA